MDSLRETDNPPVSPAAVEGEASRAESRRADWGIVRWLWPFLEPYKGRFLLGSLSGVLDSGCQILILRLLDPAVAAASDGNLSELPLILFAIFGLVLLKSVFNFLQEYLVFSAGLSAVMDLRNKVYAHLQTLSLGYFHRTSTGQLLSRLTNDVQVIENGLTNNITNVVTGPSSIIFGIGFLISMNWRLSLLAFILVPLVVLVVQQGNRPMRRASRQKQERQADLSAIIEETISGVRVVQSFGGEAREVNRFQKEAREAFRAAMRGVRVLAILIPVMEVVTILAVIAIIALGAMEIKAGRTDAAELLAFIMILNKVAASFKQLGRTHTQFQQTLNATERLKELSEVEPEVREALDAKPLPSVQGDIEFEEVVFGYDPETPILRGVSFHAEPGQMVAFVGSSGAGKTTLVNLVPRFYDPQSGLIRVDGEDIRGVKLSDLRAHIGIVPQETQLFSGTVAENIAYGKPDASHEEIVAAAQAANAHSFVEELSEGYETRVGERGAKLSGGQRQRIAIARAVLKDPAILILDEATSSLDPESEQLVAEALERLMRGRTTLVIAHRLSTIRRAHRIFVMEAGRIVEEGSEEELLALEGAYARLFHAQFAEDAETATGSAEKGNSLAAASETAS